MQMLMRRGSQAIGQARERRQVAATANRERRRLSVYTSVGTHIEVRAQLAHPARSSSFCCCAPSRGWSPVCPSSPCRPPAPWVTKTDKHNVLVQNLRDLFMPDSKSRVRWELVVMLLLIVQLVAALGFAHTLGGTGRHHSPRAREHDGYPG